MKSFKKFFAYFSALTLIFTINPITTQASTLDTNKENIQKKIEDKINEIKGKTIYSEDGKLSMDMSNFRIDLDDSKLEDLSYSELKQVYEGIENIVNEYENINLGYSKNIEQSAVQPYQIDAPVSTYKSNVDVWCGIPSGGSAYIRIRYETSIQSGCYFNASVLDSWMTSGASYASWTHHYGSIEYFNGNRSMYVKATGTLTYPLGPGNAYMDATFQGTV